MQTVRFPLTDAGNDLIWGEVRDFVLRQRPTQDGLREGLEKRALFERYRPMLEMLASGLFDEGKFQRDESTGKLVVRVPYGRL
jgi:hypothetical protein